MPVPGLSLIIPCYNEAGRVELLLKGLAAFDRQWTGLYEILLVDDGSTDDTFARIQQHAHYHALKQKHNIRMLQQSNHGKGHALRTGILQATQAFVLTLDADMSASPMELQYWMPDETSWQQQVIWIGSRELAASAIKEKPWRKYVGHVFNYT